MVYKYENEHEMIRIVTNPKTIKVYCHMFCETSTRLLKKKSYKVQGTLVASYDRPEFTVREIKRDYE